MANLTILLAPPPPTLHNFAQFDIVHINNKHFIVTFTEKS